MSLFGSLYVGASGIQAGMSSLNTTAHNLSNVDTKGYTRQTVDQADRAYLNVGSAAIAALQTGMGVSIADVTQFRDVFLDRQYRTEAGRSGYYEAMYDASYEVETYFQETFAEDNQSSVQTALSELQYAMNEMAKDPESSVNKEFFVLKSMQFLERAQNIYTSLCEYQDSLNDQIKSKVNRINELGKTIYETNAKIGAIEAGNVEDANDYRDARNLALDELASLVDITYETDAHGYVNVKIEGTTFVNAAQVYEMGVEVEDLSTGFYTPVWPHLDGREVFQSNVYVSPDNGNDIGYLKGLVLARGDHRATYADIEVLNRAIDDVAGNSMTETEAEKAYNETINTSVVMKAQAEFDQLVNGIVTAINDILCKDIYAAEGNKAPEELFVRYTVPERFAKLSKEQIAAAGITKGEDGFYVTDDATAATVKLSQNPVTGVYEVDEAGTYTLTNEGYLVDEAGYYVMNEEQYEDAADIYEKENNKYMYKKGGTFAAESLYTISNLVINQDIIEDNAKLDFITDDGKVDMAKAEELASVWEESFKGLNPCTRGEVNYNVYYTSFMDEMGELTSKFTRMYQNEQDSVLSVDNTRQGVIGVNSDEELTNMIRYQNAYNAASRYFNVVDEMLEHLLTSLG